MAVDAVMRSVFSASLLVITVVVVVSGAGFQQGQTSGDLDELRVLYEWSKLDYEWPDDSTKARALTSNQFLPENNALAGIKVWGERVFLSIPRWREGVPVTVATVPTFSQGDSSPKLRPFPSWEMQTIGNCTAIQNVHGMEIDTAGRLWVVDAGRVNTASPRSDDRCPPKLLVFDLISGYKLVHKFIFPPSVASGTSSFLSDIVLDGTSSGGGQPDDWYAYISDSGDGAIVVYSMREDRAWKVQDVNSMRGDTAAADLIVAGTQINLLYGPTKGGVDGIALAPLKHGSRYLYYSPLASLHIFAIPTDMLRDSNARVISGGVIDLGQKSSQSRGMMMDERGILYYGLLGRNAVARWNSTNSTAFQFGGSVPGQYSGSGGLPNFGGATYGTDDPRRPLDNNNRGGFGGISDGVPKRGALQVYGSEVRIAEDAQLLQWPDTFAFDSTGNLWLTSNRLQNLLSGRVNLDEPNYRVIRGFTGTKSYMYGDGSDGRWSPGSGRGMNNASGSGRDDRRWSGSDLGDTRGTWNSRDDPEDRSRPPYLRGSTYDPQYSSTVRPAHGAADSIRTGVALFSITATSLIALFLC